MNNKVNQLMFQTALYYNYNYNNYYYYYYY